MWSEAKFSSGQGSMKQEDFDTYVKNYGIDQAVWVAKYFGVALSTVKAWVAIHLH